MLMLLPRIQLKCIKREHMQEHDRMFVRTLSIQKNRCNAEGNMSYISHREHCGSSKHH